MSEYMIRNSETKQFSGGIIRRGWQKSHYVNFKARGKVWTTETLLKQHLLKCFQQNVKMENWEIVEVQYVPTKPIEEWVDGKMLLKILKN